MGKQFLLLLLLVFVSCSQNEEQQESNTKTNSITTMPSIDRVYSDYKEAFRVAKERNRPVFILFTTKYCRWCTKLKETTLKEQEIIMRLNSEYIVLLLDKNHSLYPSKYKVSAVPSVYITDKNEEIFTSIVGYHKNPHDYIKWFNYVKIELSN
jgi:thioredoxin-related protein